MIRLLPDWPNIHRHEAHQVRFNAGLIDALIGLMKAPQAKPDGDEPANPGAGNRSRAVPHDYVLRTMLDDLPDQPEQASRPAVVLPF